MRTRALVGSVVVAAALAVPSAASAQSGSPGCYGQYVAGFAHLDGGNGAVVSNAAQALKGPNNGNPGQDGVPVLKAIACA
jgi:hypothetical protein